jgi:hypothetical protein
MQAHIVMMILTFHGSTINNHDLEAIDFPYTTKGLLINSMMYTIMGASIIDEDNEFLMLDIAN